MNVVEDLPTLTDKSRVSAVIENLIGNHQNSHLLLSNCLAVEKKAFSIILLKIVRFEMGL